ncbi:MAG: RagB/SusD family nutrient uptake outer membrane protein [Bacteroidetes bacterium]|nr:RagB/SusD family nutrient uptake outer membrane protein [Bacteroidota bacterium]
MKTKQTIIRHILLFSLPLLAGCSKYLEKSPDNRTELNSPEKVSQLLGTAYPQGNYMGFAEAMSDNVADKGVGTVDITNATSYVFGDVIDPNQDSPEYYWNACYSAIAAANQALKACEEAANPGDYSSQRGEALVARAYNHFMLVTLFANAYDPTTAGNDPGIPYVTEPENVVIKQYERGTVASVYANIEADLTAGLPLLDDSRYNVPKYHFTKMAANAFACRFFLYKGEFQKAVDHANTALGSGNVVNYLRPWNTTYRNMTFQELFETYARASTAANLLLVEASSLYARQYYTLRYAMTSAKNTEIFGQNVTGADWSFNFQTYTAGSNNYLIPKINEYFVQSSVNANIGLPYVMIPLFTAEELLFNRAEANAWLNNTTAALSDLNAYASTRMEDYSSSANRITTTKIRQFYGISDPQIGIVRTILDFKRAEFAQEGMRWFDILRFRLAVAHRTSDGELHVLTNDDPRRLLQLPQSTSLSGLTPNPR